MKKMILAVLAAVACGCSHTVLVPVPPAVDLKAYGTLGIIDFSSNAERALSTQATRQFQEQVQEAQPGTELAEDFPSRADLAALGYTTVEDLDGADQDELVRAGLKPNQAKKIIAALA
jgi:hypothetical protein